MQLVVLFLISGSVRAVWKSAEDMHCIFVSTKGGFAWKFTYYDRYFFCIQELSNVPRNISIMPHLLSQIRDIIP